VELHQLEFSAVQLETTCILQIDLHGVAVVHDLCVTGCVAEVNR
jgi:hypothetical protein